MEPEIPLPTDLRPDSDDLFVIEPGPETPYPLRRRRAVTLVVTVAWMIVLCALCAYLLMRS